MRVSRIKQDGYTCVYFEMLSAGSESHVLAVQWLDRYELDDGCILWRIGATYAKSLEPAYYYVVARDKQTARKKFEYKFPWLAHIKSIMPLSAESAEEILTKPAKHPVW